MSCGRDEFKVTCEHHNVNPAAVEFKILPRGRDPNPVYQMWLDGDTLKKIGDTAGGISTERVRQIVIKCRQITMYRIKSGLIP